jgi:MoaA/NifB/PqqE/SkfB family radical SAM enzyme
MCTRVGLEEATLEYGLLKKIFPLFPYLEHVEWQGGEVFLLDYFKDLFEKTAGFRNIRQCITTNGLFIDEEWAKMLSFSRTILRISVDAVTKGTYEAIRRNAKYEDLLKSLYYIKEQKHRGNEGFRLSLSAVAMKSNYRELDKFPEFCLQYGITSLGFSVLLPDAVPWENIYAESPDNLKIKNYLKDEIKNIKAECERYGIYFYCQFYDWLFPEEKNETISGIDIDNKTKIRCFKPWSNLHLEADAYFRPSCECIRDIGNLTRNTIDEIWNGEKMLQYRKYILANQEDKICSDQCKLYRDLNC